MSVSAYIHLRCRSAYSLLRGAMTVKDLTEYAKSMRFPALAITDHDNLFGSLEFSESLMKQGVQPIIGTLVSVVPDGHVETALLKPSQADQLLLIAKDQRGYSNLLKLSTQSYIQPAMQQPTLLSYDTVCAHAEGVICLTAGRLGGV